GAGSPSCEQIHYVADELRRSTRRSSETRITQCPLIICDDQNSASIAGDEGRCDRSGDNERRTVAGWSDDGQNVVLLRAPATAIVGDDADFAVSQIVRGGEPGNHAVGRVDCHARWGEGEREGKRVSVRIGRFGVVA